MPLFSHVPVCWFSHVMAQTSDTAPMTVHASLCQNLLKTSFSHIAAHCNLLCFRTGYQGDNFVRYSGDAQNFAKKQSRCLYYSLIGIVNARKMIETKKNNHTRHAIRSGPQVSWVLCCIAIYHRSNILKVR